MGVPGRPLSDDRSVAYGVPAERGGVCVRLMSPQTDVRKHRPRWPPVQPRPPSSLLRPCPDTGLCPAGAPGGGEAACAPAPSQGSWLAVSCLRGCPAGPPLALLRRELSRGLVVAVTPQLPLRPRADPLLRPQRQPRLSEGRSSGRPALTAPFVSGGDPRLVQRVVKPEVRPPVLITPATETPKTPNGHIATTQTGSQAQRGERRSSF